MAEALDRDEAKAAFKRFKEAVAENAAVPKVVKEKRPKHPRKKKPT